MLKTNAILIAWSAEAETMKTITDLAEELNVTRQTIYNWRSGFTKPPGHIEKHIEKITNKTFDKFVKV